MDLVESDGELRLLLQRRFMLALVIKTSDLIGTQLWQKQKSFSIPQLHYISYSLACSSTAI